jgi:hypothetical protein
VVPFLSLSRFFSFFFKKKNPNFWPSSFGTKMICWTFGIMKNEKKSEKKRKEKRHEDRRSKKRLKNQSSSSKKKTNKRLCSLGIALLRFDD